MLQDKVKYQANVTNLYFDWKPKSLQGEEIEDAQIEYVFNGNEETPDFS